MRAFLTDVGFPPIERIHISVSTIGFVDGTAWGGTLYRRDPGTRHGWRAVDKPKGSARNRTAFSYKVVPTSYDVDSRFQSEGLLGMMTTSKSSLLQPAPPQEGQCGSALAATYDCPDQPPGCNYDRVSDFDPNNPDKPDALQLDGC